MNPSNSSSARFTRWLTPLVYLSSNAISLTGVVLVTAATVLWVFLLPTLVRGEIDNPYLGIPAFMLLPGVFIFGLILIPIGIFIKRKRMRSQGIADTSLPPLSFESKELRKLVGFVLATSVVNVIIAGQWGYSAVNYMDSDKFCGLTCHKVMAPEHTAYVNSPHAHVGCVNCHIGPGASWFVKSKLSGVGQVIAVTFNTYPKPIPSPVENLRPARETCEHCHWPQRFSGDIFRVRASYSNDEKSEAAYTVLLLKVGGNTWRGGVGIHGAHVDPKASMVYIATDRQRQTIPQVTYTAPDGKVTVFKDKDSKATAQELARGETRTMDCMDCHNRPAHTYQLPEKAVDEAMLAGRISNKLPFVKKESVAALRHDYADRDTAVREIARALEGFYQSKYPQVATNNASDIKTTVEAVKAIYLQNIFPEMKVTWGMYPNNLGHMDFPGCFRCHDGNHVSADGRAISNDCATCHDVLAMEEKSPKVLGDLGYHGAQ